MSKDVFSVLLKGQINKGFFQSRSFVLGKVLEGTDLWKFAFLLVILECESIYGYN